MSKTKSLYILSGSLLVAAACSIAAYAATAQPKMDAALAALQNARAQLVAANNNKGGHLPKAINLVDQAIAETKMGMASAN